MTKYLIKYLFQPKFIVPGNPMFAKIKKSKASKKRICSPMNTRY